MLMSRVNHPTTSTVSFTEYTFRSSSCTVSSLILCNLVGLQPLQLKSSFPVLKIYNNLLLKFRAAEIIFGNKYFIIHNHSPYNVFL